MVSFRGEVLSLGLFHQGVVHTTCLQLWQVDPVLGIAHAYYGLMLLSTHFPPNSWVLSLSPGNALIVIGFLMFVTKYSSHKMQIFVHSHNSIPYYVLFDKPTIIYF